jgi:hypothetical protein
MMQRVYSNDGFAFRVAKKESRYVIIAGCSGHHDIQIPGDSFNVNGGLGYVTLSKQPGAGTPPTVSARLRDESLPSTPSPPEPSCVRGIHNRVHGLRRHTRFD